MVVEQFHSHKNKCQRSYPFTTTVRSPRHLLSSFLFSSFRLRSRHPTRLLPFSTLKSYQVGVVENPGLTDTRDKDIENGRWEWAFRRKVTVLWDLNVDSFTVERDGQTILSFTQEEVKMFTFFTISKCKIRNISTLKS